MTGVTTIEQQNQMLQYLQQMQSQGATLEEQIASGQKSQPAIQVPMRSTTTAMARKR